jgi:hypothetical protein
MAIVDASFLVASWNEGEPFHKEARRRLAAMPPGTKLRVNAGALVEASQIIRKAAKSAGQDGPGASRNFLGAFLALPGASIFTAHADEAWPLHVSNKPSASRTPGSSPRQGPRTMRSGPSTRAW